MENGGRDGRAESAAPPSGTGAASGGTGGVSECTPVPLTAAYVAEISASYGCPPSELDSFEVIFTPLGLPEPPHQPFDACTKARCSPPQSLPPFLPLPLARRLPMRQSFR